MNPHPSRPFRFALERPLKGKRVAYGLVLAKSFASVVPCCTARIVVSSRLAAAVDPAFANLGNVEMTSSPKIVSIARF